MTSVPVFFPRSVEDASELLTEYDGTAKVVAGSTALTLMMKQNLVSPQAFVSLSRIPDLQDVALDAGVVRLGALVSHANAARDPVLRKQALVLAEAFSVVGNAQVRNSATVGGVIAEADYASDPPAAMVLLDSSVVARQGDNSRVIAAEDLFVGFYETSLSDHEIITEVRVPAVPVGAGTAYLKYSSRSSEDRPCVGVAALALLDAQGACLDLRVSVGAACEVPLRLRETEANAAGQVVNEELIASVCASYAEKLDPVSDVRGSAWYRTEMTAVWVGRAVRAALDRCSQP